MSSFYSREELQEIGFKNFGENVNISRKASIYAAKNISIGNNVRIDDFCILSGEINIGNYVHLGAGCYLFAGNEGIDLHDFTGVSHHSCIYAVSDDYTGICLTNPTIPDKYRKIQKGKVTLEKHAIIGASSVILPGVTIAEGCAIGALSLVTKTPSSWEIYFGSPAKSIKTRNKNLLKLEKELLNDIK